MKRILFIALCSFVLSVFGCYGETFNGRLVPPQFRFTVVYVDTMTIKSPVLISIDGVVFLTSKSNLYKKKPLAFLNGYGTCAVLANVLEDSVSGKISISTNFDLTTLFLNPNAAVGMAKLNHKSVTPHFKYTGNFDKY